MISNNSRNECDRTLWKNCFWLSCSCVLWSCESFKIQKDTLPVVDSWLDDVMMDDDVITCVDVIKVVADDVIIGDDVIIVDDLLTADKKPADDVITIVEIISDDIIRADVVVLGFDVMVADIE